jgi:nitroreductase
MPGHILFPVQDRDGPAVYFQGRNAKMDFLELAQNRCTTRGFTDKKIDKADLDRILSAGRLAPTACNRQPQRIIVVQHPENLLRVQKAYQTFGSQCVLIICQDKKDPLVRPFDGKCSGDLDIGIICDHMMLAARELNIGSVMVGLFDPKIIRNEFNIPETIEPTALLILGYPADGFLSPDRHKTDRKPLEDTVMYERYSEGESLNQGD